MKIDHPRTAKWLNAALMCMFCLPAMADGVQKGVYFPNTEELAPDEMRVISCGTGLPTPLTKAQKSLVLVLSNTSSRPPSRLPWMWKSRKFLSFSSRPKTSENIQVCLLRLPNSLIRS